MKNHRLVYIMFALTALVILLYLKRINHMEKDPAIFENSHVRKCISGHIIGEIPNDLKLEPFNITVKPNARRNVSDEDSFQSIYREWKWGSPESVSGPGSEMKYTSEIIATLHVVINQLKSVLKKDVISVLDVPCGDMNWMTRFLASRNDIDYTGVDIVPDLIAKHKKDFSGRLFKFHSANIVEAGLQQSYDLVFSRMMTQHLHDSDVQKFLKAVSDSGSKYLLMTTFPHNRINQELQIAGNNSGRMRYINFELPPFSLSPPLCLEHDGPPGNTPLGSEHHFVGLWELPLGRVAHCEGIQKPKYKGVEFYSCVQWELWLP